MSYNLARFELSNIIEEGVEDYVHSCFTVCADLLGKSEACLSIDYEDWIDHHYLFGLKFSLQKDPNHWSVYFRVALFGKYFRYNYSPFKGYTNYEAK